MKSYNTKWKDILSGTNKKKRITVNWPAITLWSPCLPHITQIHTYLPICPIFKFIFFKWSPTVKISHSPWIMPYWAYFFPNAEFPFNTCTPCSIIQVPRKMLSIIVSNTGGLSEALLLYLSTRRWGQAGNDAERGYTDKTYMERLSHGKESGKKRDLHSGIL